VQGIDGLLTSGLPGASPRADRGAAPAGRYNVASGSSVRQRSSLIGWKKIVTRFCARRNCLADNARQHFGCRFIDSDCSKRVLPFQQS
jgi:hypothetical protein